MRRIKVLHIQGGTITSGAGRGAYWLHRALIEKGVDSKFLIQSGQKQLDFSVIPASSQNRIKDKIQSMTLKDAGLLEQYPDRDPFLFSPGMHGIKVHRLEEYNKADIIHLHWINWGFLSIEEISKIDKPIVWTFRDPWPFTGGCHLPYVHSCERYKLNCGCCPHLASRDMFDLSWQVMRQKKKSFHRNIHPVAMSQWMYNRIRESALFGDFEVELIPNNIDTRVFYPYEKRKAREILGLDPHKKIILFGTTNLEDKHKGLDKFLGAMAQYPNKDRVVCAFFGKGQVNSRLPAEPVNFGQVKDDSRLRLIYSAADVFVAPLKHDNFSKTVGEAMACGLPVVNILNEEGNPVMVHKSNCFLASSDLVGELQEGIDWVLSLDDKTYWSISENARKSVMAACSFETVSQQYIGLYSRIL